MQSEESVDHHQNIEAFFRCKIMEDNYGCQSLSSVTKTVNLLLELGASLDSRDKRGLTPLDYAVIHNNLSMIRFLIKAGADYNVVHGCSGQWEAETALHLAASRSSVPTIQLLIQCGSPVNVGDRHGETPAIKAAKAGRTDVVEFLGKLGADLTLRDVNDWGLLHWATWCKHESTVRWLLEMAAANVNSRDRYGSTPLHTAAERGHESIASILIKYGADPRIVNCKKQVPLDCADLSKNPFLAELLKISI